MKTIITLAALLPLLAFAQSPRLPETSATLVRQFEGFEEKTLSDAQRSVDAARVKLLALLTEQANKAAPGDAATIRAYIATVQQEAREASAPSSFAFWNANRTVAGYYNNNPTMVVTVDAAGKKRSLVVHGNQGSKKTVGEIFLVRDDRNESKVGEWRTGASNPLEFDVSGFVTKPGTYIFRLRYKDGGDEFVCDKLGIQITK